MYKIKNRIINFPDNVNCYSDKVYFYFIGPLGDIKHKLSDLLNITIKEKKIIIEGKTDIHNVREYLSVKSLLSTTYVLFNNYIKGVLFFFDKSLVLKGIGYKFEIESNKNILIINVGYSHPVSFNIPNDVFIELVNNTEIRVKGISKHRVGQIAANIRSKKVPDNYKGNGIRYKNEIINLKVSKKTK